MAELIDRAAVNAALEELDALMQHRAETEDEEFIKVQVGITLASCEIEALPTIDAVEVVRCGECVHANPIPDAKAKYFADGVKCCEILRGDETYGVSVVWDEGFCDEGARMDADAPERGGKDGRDG